MADSRVLLSNLAQWCSHALELTAFSEGLFDRLAAVLPFQGAFLATVDPATLLYTRAFRRDMPGEASAAFVAAEFGDDDVNQLRDLVNRPAPIGWLDQATRGDRMSAKRYREAMRPFGLGDELRCALVSADSCWGLLCLHRGETDPAFTGSEAALLARLSPYVAQALRTSLLLEQSSVASAGSGPGVLVLSPAGELRASTLAGSQLLEQLAELDAPRSARLPTVVAGVVERLRSGTGHRPVVARARALTRQGQWLTVHASRLDDKDASIAVIVEPTQPAELAPLLIAAYCLTPREAEVARALMLGSSRQLIASHLRLSPFTVNDHVRAVFTKTDVSSAGQLRMKIFRG
jgi:DNA-binding CsgD family transcriptional regulator/GAF domain-containing protein